LVGVTDAEDEGTCVSPSRVRLEVEVARRVSDCCTSSIDVSDGSSAIKGVAFVELLELVDLSDMLT